jgi:DNA-binding PadR family transcriptional regulator
MGDVRPEYVFLGFLAESPAHGYQLYQQFKKDLSGLWHISESQMYASLKRLEKRGWIAPDEKTPAGADADANTEAEAGDTYKKVDKLPPARQSRQCYSLTATGLAAYESWLSSPSPASPRLLKLEFLSRLYFALRRDVELAYAIVEAQRSALEQELDRLTGTLLPAGGEQKMADQGHQSEASFAAQKEPLLFDINILARDFRIRQIQSTLEWLKNLL